MTHKSNYVVSMGDQLGGLPPEGLALCCEVTASFLVPTHPKLPAAYSRLTVNAHGGVRGAPSGGAPVPPANAKTPTAIPSIHVEGRSGGGPRGRSRCSGPVP